VSVLLKLRSALAKAVRALTRLARRLRRRPEARPGSRRVLVPFARGHLDPTVLTAAIRVARAEEATLVPAYLILIPLEMPLDAPMSQECELGVPLLEAVERAASRAGVRVDARIESGRTPIHALERLWNVEQFDRIVIPAPAGREPGFAPKELLWMLTNAPSETVILRPERASSTIEPSTPGGRERVAPSLQRMEPTTPRSPARNLSRVPATQPR
jgi:hypothetical protein